MFVYNLEFSGDHSKHWLIWQSLCNLAADFGHYDDRRAHVICLLEVLDCSGN